MNLYTFPHFLLISLLSIVFACESDINALNAQTFNFVSILCLYIGIKRGNKRKRQLLFYKSELVGANLKFKYTPKDVWLG